MTQSTAHELNEERRLSEIEHRLDNLTKKIDVLSRDVEDLVTAWKAANWIVSLVKWFGGIAMAVTAFMALVKGIKT